MPWMAVDFDNDMCLYAFEKGEDIWAHIYALVHIPMSIKTLSTDSIQSYVDIINISMASKEHR